MAIVLSPDSFIFGGDGAGDGALSFRRRAKSTSGPHIALSLGSVAARVQNRSFQHFVDVLQMVQGDAAGVFGVRGCNHFGVKDAATVQLTIGSVDGNKIGEIRGDAAWWMAANGGRSNP